MLYIIRPALFAALLLACLSGVLDGQNAGGQRSTRRAYLYYRDALRYQYLGDLRQAQRRLSASLAADSLFVPAHIRLQDILTARGKADSLRQAYLRMKNDHPDSPLYTCLWGRLLADSEKARESFDRAIELDSLFYWGYACRGYYFLDTGSYRDAVRDFKRAVRINPARTYAQMGLGLSYAHLDMLSRAVRQYRKALLISPQTEPEAYYYLGLAHLALADTAASLQRFTEFIRIVETGPEYAFAKAQIAALKRR